MVDLLLLDVFTDRPYAGNPLAVVLDADGLDERSMRLIANELNLSETVFLGSARPDGTWPTRIFTPRVELPFAGHPSVGAAIALATEGHIALDDGNGRCVLAEPVGPVPVHVRIDGGTATARFAVPQRPARVDGIDRPEGARLTGLEESDLHPDVDPGVWSAGVDFAVVVVRDIGALARSTPAGDATHLYVIAPVDDSPLSASTWRARMFAPAMGISEDPATGAAAAATAGLLAGLDASHAGSRTWVIHQGVEMGRPSRIEVTVQRDALGEMSTVFVGGSAVLVGRGSLQDPA